MNICYSKRLKTSKKWNQIIMEEFLKKERIMKISFSKIKEIDQLDN